MEFVIVCMTCLKGTKHDALESSKGLVCNKCGADL
jgi:DNA-directed RNA polymerase subunit RPC12/RpoP